MRGEAGCAGGRVAQSTAASPSANAPTGLLLTPGSVSVLIDRLESARACRRVPHPTDRRATLLELTDEATRLGEQVGPRDYETAVLEAAASLTSAQRAAARFLEAVTNAAAAHVARLRPTPPTTRTIDIARVPDPGSAARRSRDR